MAKSFVPLRQRRAMRRHVRLECQVIRERDFRLLSTETVDVSPDGLLVRTEAQVLTGEGVFVSMRVPQSKVWVDGVAVVARVVHGRRPGDRGRALGLSLLEVDPFARAVLTARLRGLPPPLPQRDPLPDYVAAVGDASGGP